MLRLDQLKNYGLILIVFCAFLLLQSAKCVNIPHYTRLETEDGQSYRLRYVKMAKEQTGMGEDFYLAFSTHIIFFRTTWGYVGVYSTNKKVIYNEAFYNAQTGEKRLATTRIFQPKEAMDLQSWTPFFKGLSRFLQLDLLTLLNAPDAYQQMQKYIEERYKISIKNT